MKDTKINGVSVNTEFVTTLSWPEFQAEYEIVFPDKSALKEAYKACYEAAGKKAVIKGTTPQNEGE